MKWKSFTTLWADKESRRYAKRERFNRDQLYRDYLEHHMTESDLVRCQRELAWYETNRAYYRLYPCILDMARDLKDSAMVRWGVLPEIDQVPCLDESFWLGCDTASVRHSWPIIGEIDKSTFLKGIVPNQMLEQAQQAVNFEIAYRQIQSLLIETPAQCNVPSILMSVITDSTLNSDEKEYRAQICYEDGVNDDGFPVFREYTLVFTDAPHTVGYILETCEDIKSPRQKKRAQEIFKLVSLLYMFTDPAIDLMERIVLNRDKGKVITPDILDRAARNSGKGWTVGRKLEELPRKSRPHWGIRWCKPDHEGEIVEGWDGTAPESRQGCVPKLRPIRGANEDFYRKVPTGYKD